MFLSRLAFYLHLV